MTGLVISHDFEHDCRAPAASVRVALTRALRDAGFEIVSELTTLVQARRGSQLAGSVQRNKLPLQVEVRLAPTEQGCRVSLQIQDRWRSPLGTSFGMEGLFRQVVGEVQAQLEQVLSRLDPEAVTTADGAPDRAGPGPGGLLDRANARLVSATSSAINATDRKLQGESRTEAAAPWQSVQAVRLDIDDDPLLLDRGEVGTVLEVAALIGVQPGTMPPNLVAQTERLAAVIEAALETGGSYPIVHLTAADRSAVTFLRQQAALRESLPARRLMVCRDCRFEKVINEDFRKLTDRNRRLTALMGGLGAVIRPGSISPFIVFGQLFRAKKLDPDFVCPRCQGLQADPFVITFCPSCGARHKDAALRSCGCGFDFRAEGARLVAKRPAVPEPAVPAAPTVPAPLAIPVPPQQLPVTPPAAPAGWFADPWHEARLRWWDGRTWTGSTAP